MTRTVQFESITSKQRHISALAVISSVESDRFYLTTNIEPNYKIGHK